MMRNLTIAVLILLATAACGDDSGGLPFSGSSTTATGEAATTTSAAGTTTTTAATTTSTTSTTTTTTAPAPPPIQYLPHGIGFAAFGDPVDTVLATAAAILGPATSDTGWLPGGFGDYGVCPGSEFRQVRFAGDALMLMFSDVDYFVGGGVRNFIHYAYYSPAFATLTAGPPVSIDVTNTVAQLTAMWPGADVTDDDPLFGPSFSYTPGAGFDGLYGTLSGVAPGDTIESIRGGVGCGE
jgi:hypothetical protein